MRPPSFLLGGRRPCLGGIVFLGCCEYNLTTQYKNAMTGMSMWSTP